MRYIIGLLLVVGLTGSTFGQFKPRLKSDEFLKKKGVKSLCTYYYDREDTTNSKKLLFYKKEFDDYGNISSEYLLSLLDVVIYDQTTNYIYNKNNKLIEKTIIQKDLKVGREYKKLMKGEDNSNQKFLYYYNKDNKLIKEDIFHFGDKGFDEKSQLYSTTSFEYKDTLLVKEILSDGNGKIMDITTYDYDSANRKIGKTKIITAMPGPKCTVKWIYNTKGLLIEEEEIDETVPFSFNDKHSKFEYDSKGRLIKELRISPENNNWVIYDTNRYDSDDELILERKNTTFHYYDNGLVKKEFRKGNPIMNLITIYKL